MNYDQENQEYAWCPLSQVKTSLSEFLEIDLGRPTILKVVETKGRYANGAGREFTPFYQIRYLREDSPDGWRSYSKFREKNDRSPILHGPLDAYINAFETLNPPIVAQRIRIFPYSPIGPKRVCLKLQLIGCDYQYGLTEYIMPQGSLLFANDSLAQLLPANESWLLYDQSYDAIPDTLSGELRRGLGCLADGIVGREVLRPHESLMLPQQFVGWHRDRLSLLSHGRSSSVMLEFRFMTLRNFSNLRLYSLSYFPAKIGYFSGLDIRFYGGPHTKMRVLDTAARFNSSCRCLDVNLVGHSGQNVRLSLAFSDDWILLSEVAFTSVVGHNRLNLESVSDRTKVSSSGPSRPVSRDITDFSVDNSGDTSKSESGGGLEAIYLLSILLCLLVGVVTAICSFWLVLVRRRSARRRISIKKRAIALAAHSHHHPPGANSYIIPYNQTNGHTLHHPQQQQQGLSSSTLPLPPPLPTYPTVDKRFYPSGSMRSMGVLVTSSNTLDPGKLLAKLSGGMDNSNVYTSILGSDNDSTLSPEYASTSMTAPVQGVSGGPDSVVYGPRLEGPFLPPPLEPLRPTGSSQLGLTLPASPSSSPSCSSPSSSSSAVPPAMSHPPSQIGPSFYPGSQPPLPPPYNLSFNDFTQPRRYHSPGYDQLRINSFI